MASDIMKIVISFFFYYNIRRRLESNKDSAQTLITILGTYSTVKSRRARNIVEIVMKPENTIRRSEVRTRTRNSLKTQYLSYEKFPRARDLPC